MSRRRLGLLLGVSLLIGIVVAAYFAPRPPTPPIPVIDLSRADPEVAEAIEAALGEVRTHPREAAPWGKLGMLLRANDFDMASVEAFAAAERFDPTDVRWPYLQGLTLALFNPDAGIACLRRAVPLASREFTDPQLRLAEMLVERGQLDEAESLAKDAAGRERDAGRSAWILARIEAERGNWSAVLQRSDAHLGNPAIRKRAALLRVTAYNRLGRVEEAARESARAREFPEDQSSHDWCVAEVLKFQLGGYKDLEQGTQLLQAGRLEEAIPVLERSVEKSRNRVPAQLVLARALNESRNPLAAQRVIEDVLQSDPNSVEGWFQQGVSQLLTEEFKDAEQSFQKAVKLKPDHALAWSNLGYVRVKLGDRPGARAAYETALRCSPNHEISRKALAELPRD